MERNKENKNYSKNNSIKQHGFILYPKSFICMFVEILISMHLPDI